MYENIKIISKSEMDGIEIGMDNPDGTKCPLGTLTWYGEDDCNAEQDEAFAEKICLAYNKYDALQARNAKQKKLIQSLIKKVPERDLTDKDIHNLIEWLGIDIEPSWNKVKQALKSAEEVK